MPRFGEANRMGALLWYLKRRLDITELGNGQDVEIGCCDIAQCFNKHEFVISGLPSRHTSFGVCGLSYKQRSHPSSLDTW